MCAMMENQALKTLYRSSRAQEKKISDLIRQCSEKVKLNLIDVGMVIKLDERDRINFTNFLKSVMEGNSEKCANMVYRMSTFDGNKIL